MSSHLQPRPSSGALQCLHQHSIPLITPFPPPLSLSPFMSGGSEINTFPPPFHPSNIPHSLSSVPREATRAFAWPYCFLKRGGIEGSHDIPLSLEQYRIRVTRRQAGWGPGNDLRNGLLPNPTAAVQLFHDSNDSLRSRVNSHSLTMRCPMMMVMVWPE